MTSKHELAYQSLRKQVYAAYRYDQDVVMVEVKELEIILGLEPPEDDEMDMDTAELSEDAIAAIARRDAALEDTQPMEVGIFDNLDVED